LSKELLLSKKKAQEKFLHSVLHNEGRCSAEFYKFVKEHRGNRVNILVIKDHEGELVTETAENANILNSFYASIFISEHDITEIESTD
jgi:hypothetical protein